ncbi:MAG: hypothetical protein GKR94_26705 [Gammaproteobacteria bacterium]|nr:hypothetical protein [Gammaproteobacteria bacterium]
MVALAAITGVYTYGRALRQGDRPVPGDEHRIESPNPNSAYHLSIKLNYPNPHERARAAAESRTSPGNNIFMHSKAVSIGCLAMAAPAVAELFVLVAGAGIEGAGIENVSIVIAPQDPRTQPLTAAGHPPWIRDRYARIEAQCSRF